MGRSPKTRFADEDGSANVKLDSWKKIAAYLDRDPRTLQMWEKSEGFPVHRHNHNSRASVYAFTAEIEEWLQTRSGKQPAGPPEIEAEPKAALSSRIVRVAGFLLASTALVGFMVVLRRSTTPQPPRPAASTAPILAVLPFEDRTSLDGSAAGALTESVVADLERMGKIQVVFQPAALRVQGGHQPIRALASELHASLVLAGAVAQTGHATRVTVELLRASDGGHLWGFTYTGPTGDALASANNEIAAAIAGDVARKLTGSAPPVPAPTPGVDPRARQAYLTGRFYWSQRDLPGLLKAIAFYQKALIIAPRYAPAYAGLAQAYDLMTDQGVLSDREAFLRAKSSAQMALKLDAGSADAWNALAFATYRQDWDFARAEQLFRKAIQFDPDSVVAHQWYGEFLGDLRRFDESIAELRRAKDLDPLSAMVGCDLADGYMHAGRLVEAESELKRVLELYPNFLPAHTYRISVALERGDLAAADAEAQVYFTRSGDHAPLDVIEIRRLAAAGKMDEARARLRRLLHASGRPPLSPYSTAQLLFTTGQFDQGYAALEQAYRAHSWWLVTMLVDPGFEPVRNQPRFLALARRVGLPLAQSPELRAAGTRP